MSKNNLEELLKQQNKLLECTNKLLENQTQLLQRIPPAREEFVGNILQDEFRSGFLVTSHRKKLWNVQAGLINEVARICRKHNLKWFAYAGTLLGAARHRGFIPWDDDVDLAMLRPDYEKFKQIAAKEIKYPYFFDDWCNYRLESDEAPTSEQFPLITRKQEDFYFRRGYFPSFPILKIRDCRTTMVEIPDMKNMNQGIWIDIFPLDFVPPFDNQKHSIIFKQACDLLIATIFPDTVRSAINEDQKFSVPLDKLQEFLNLPYSKRARAWEIFMLNNYFQSQKVGHVRHHCIKKVLNDNSVKNLNRLIRLPFEKTEILAPEGYDEFLKEIYGDWRKPVFSPGHTREFFISADVPYDEYFRKSALVR